jgi:hypothetical protein
VHFVVVNAMEMHPNCAMLPINGIIVLMNAVYTSNEEYQTQAGMSKALE